MNHVIILQLSPPSLDLPDFWRRDQGRSHLEQYHPNRPGVVSFDSATGSIPSASSMEVELPGANLSENGLRTVPGRFLGIYTHGSSFISVPIAGFMEKKVRPCAACSTRVGVTDSLDADFESKLYYGTVFQSPGSDRDHQKSSNSEWLSNAVAEQGIQGLNIAFRTVFRAPGCLYGQRLDSFTFRALSHWHSEVAILAQQSTLRAVWLNTKQPPSGHVSPRGLPLGSVLSSPKPFSWCLYTTCARANNWRERHGWVLSHTLNKLLRPSAPVVEWTSDVTRLAGKTAITSGISPITRLQALLIYGSRTDEQEECSVKSALSKIEDIEEHVAWIHLLDADHTVPGFTVGFH
ncbi:hypothetical protein DFH94DRAFT_685440 [Russula ochroleuca]|uniref:Uncharacterized protein n=1 Tax=Russula ochroleuca TaxID=152965 RepID=A0A9P5JYJ5_9AGAM|nr:hypothetical protein DFH94DRAFT_685440 [Russula ochroleuca]